MYWCRNLPAWRLRVFLKNGNFHFHAARGGALDYFFLTLTSPQATKICPPKKTEFKTRDNSRTLHIDLPEIGHVTSVPLLEPRLGLPAVGVCVLFEADWFPHRRNQ